MNNCFAIEYLISSKSIRARMHDFSTYRIVGQGSAGKPAQMRYSLT